MSSSIGILLGGGGLGLGLLGGLFSTVRGYLGGISFVNKVAESFPSVMSRRGCRGEGFLGSALRGGGV